MPSENHHELPELLTAKLVCQQVVPVSTMSLWRWVRDGRFPAPVKMSGRNYWRRDEIDAWLAERSAVRGEAA